MTQHQQTTEEARYDTETLRKVTALAQRLQLERQDTLTAHEMEQIGSEVGLQPAVVREALQQVTQRQQTAPQAVTLTPPLRRAIVGAWWATGWMLLPLLFTLLALPFAARHPGPVVFSAVLGWATYIGGGIILGGWMKEGGKVGEPAIAESQPLSRHDLLDALFTLQHVLEGQKQHRAFLSVDVVGSRDMKRGEADLAVEYSFGQLQSWVADTVRAYGGEMHSAAGDGMMCVFLEDAAALRAARALQEGIDHFNRGRNRLSTPFRIRCGLTAGEVAVDPRVSLGQMHSPVIDRAAHLQKCAVPGDIVVGGELAAVALVELGRLGPTTSPGSVEPVFSWSAGSVPPNP